MNQNWTTWRYNSHKKLFSLECLIILLNLNQEFRRTVFFSWVI
jgi:hypothetical protein